MRTGKALFRARLVLQTTFASVFALSLLAAGEGWTALSGTFASFQAVPLFLRVLSSGSVIAFALLLSLLVCTALFGRLYCSLLCPLGAVMDAASLAGGGRGYSYRPPRRRFQSLFFVFVVLAASLGLPLFLDLVDPYGIFARGVRAVFRPFYALFVALWDGAARAAGGYGPPPVSLETGAAFFALASAVFASVTASAILVGRLFCRTLCPAGAVFELAASFSPFGIRMLKHCTGCRSCEKACPASCIDSQRRKVDRGRCVLCLSCLSACTRSAVGYGLCTGNARPHAVRQPSGPLLSRRDFLALAGTGTLAFILPLASRRLPFLASSADQVILGGIPRLPAVAPGAVSAARFARFCTGCGLCVDRCPTGVLRHAPPRPASLSLADAALRPFLDYSRAWCAYDCVACSRICPTGALLPLAPETKRTVSVGESVFERSRCIVVTKGTSCGACAEHCPTGAVSMRTVLPGRPTEPYLQPDFCVGCGACETVCPALPLKAIWVSGLPIHRTARVPSGGSVDEGNSGFLF